MWQTRAWNTVAVAVQFRHITIQWKVGLVPSEGIFVGRKVRAACMHETNVC